MKTTLPCIYFKYKSKHYLRNNSLRNRHYSAHETFCKKATFCFLRRYMYALHFFSDIGQLANASFSTVSIEDGR